jgi:hypothetical protein
MPNEITLAALTRKRAELMGQIETAQVHMRRLVMSLDHVDATIRLFDPDIDLGQVAPRKVPPPFHAMHGELSRIILDTLREAHAPLATRALTEVVMRGRGLDVHDPQLIRLMGRRMIASLAHWRRKRVVRSMPGPGQQLLWELVGLRDGE